MSKTELVRAASSLPDAWRSVVVGKAANANLKVLRMDGLAYPNETHEFNEALLVLDGQMKLEPNGVGAPRRGLPRSRRGGPRRGTGQSRHAGHHRQMTSGLIRL